MLRTFNYTGRHRITLDRISIDLWDADPGPYRCDVDLNLSEMPLDPNCRVYIEAYYRSSAYQRLDAGTVAEPSTTSGVLLDAIPKIENVLFRVKVVDESDSAHGRIVAVADRVRPNRIDGEETDRRLSILWVDPDDLGDELWRVSFEGEMPVLLVNNSGPVLEEEIKGIVQSDPAFRSLVMPAAARAVLQQLMLVERIAFDPADEEWPGLWYRFARELVDEEPPDPTIDDTVDERMKWIDAVVAEFARSSEARARYEGTVRVMGRDDG